MIVVFLTLLKCYHYMDVIVIIKSIEMSMAKILGLPTRVVIGHHGNRGHVGFNSILMICGFLSDLTSIKLPRDWIDAHNGVKYLENHHLYYCLNKYGISVNEINT